MTTVPTNNGEDGFTNVRRHHTRVRYLSWLAWPGIILFVSVSLFWLVLRTLGWSRVDATVLRWSPAAPLFFFLLIVIVFAWLLWILWDQGFESQLKEKIKAAQDRTPGAIEDNELRDLIVSLRREEHERFSGRVRMLKRAERFRPKQWIHHAQFGYRHLDKTHQGHARRTVLIMAIAVGSVAGSLLYFYTTWPALTAWIFGALLPAWAALKFYATPFTEPAGARMSELRQDLMPGSFPGGRTAFLVIHGIGEQNPLETLDGFARGIIADLRERNVEFDPNPVHHIAQRMRATGNSEWTESFVRINSRDGSASIDIHEYYWANLTEEKISVAEVLGWARKTLAGALRYFNENKELQQRFEARQLRRGYGSGMKQIVLLLDAMMILVPLAYLLHALIQAARLVPPVWTLLTRIEDWVKEETRALIIGYVGDIAIYTTMDEKSRHYALRQQILAESETLLDELLRDKDNDRVIIAGHSLGSVIAYDTLNRLNLKANALGDMESMLGKLGGLITFGSPLDKIAFFFREHTTRQQAVRRQILGFLHSFKAQQLDATPNDPEMKTRIVAKLDWLPWVNYYDERDPISGHLDFYTIPDQDNVELEMGAPWGYAHIKYWSDKNFYRDIGARYL